MIVGVPRETKSDESRVGMLPVGVRELSARGHRVLVESGAGVGSGSTDEAYAAAGAEVVASAGDVWAADLVVKVKEPLPDEWPRMRPGQFVFTYFHLAADRALTEAVRASGVTAVAYETLRGPAGDLPLLTPMSEVAGRMGTQAGATFLERPRGGRGVLLGGVPGVRPARVVVLGGGVVGKNAAGIAAGFGADVTILDVNVGRLRHLEDVMPPNVTTLFSDRHNVTEELRRADLVVGAVLIPGARAPRLVTADDLTRMQPGAVIVDVCIDQGGCVETSRPTSHAEPTYVVDDVVHYCVTNIPGAVGRTSTPALCNVTFPYVLKLAENGPSAFAADDGFAAAVNSHGGAVTNAAVADTFGFEFVPLTIG
ncbi:MAG: alanine dehydrogenase [Planctomycetota bacterium]